jgi:hypothetical protein
MIFDMNEIVQAEVSEVSSLFLQSFFCTYRIPCRKS